MLNNVNNVLRKLSLFFFFAAIFLYCGNLALFFSGGAQIPISVISTLIILWFTSSFFNAVYFVIKKIKKEPARHDWFTIATVAVSLLFYLGILVGTVKL